MMHDDDDSDDDDDDDDDGDDDDVDDDDGDDDDDDDDGDGDDDDDDDDEDDDDDDDDEEEEEDDGLEGWCPLVTPPTLGGIPTMEWRAYIKPKFNAKGFSTYCRLKALRQTHMQRNGQGTVCKRSDFCIGPVSRPSARVLIPLVPLRLCADVCHSSAMWPLEFEDDRPS